MVATKTLPHLLSSPSWTNKTLIPPIPIRPHKTNKIFWQARINSKGYLKLHIAITEHNRLANKPFLRRAIVSMQVVNSVKTSELTIYKRWILFHPVSSILYKFLIMNCKVVPSRWVRIQMCIWLRSRCKDKGLTLTKKAFITSKVANIEILNSRLKQLRSQ